MRWYIPSASQKRAHTERKNNEKNHTYAHEEKAAGSQNCEPAAFFCFVDVSIKGGLADDYSGRYSTVPSGL